MLYLNRTSRKSSENDILVTFEKEGFIYLRRLSVSQEVVPKNQSFKRASCMYGLKSNITSGKANDEMIRKLI